MHFFNKKIFESFFFYFSLIVIIWCVFVLANLGRGYMVLWDESHYALNTFEFLKHKNPFLVTAYGKPDYWNTKPPMAIWLQAISVKCFGFNEFAVRFPSALAGLLTTVLFLVFSKKFLKTYIVGFIASVILFSISFYNGYHIIRTADVDGILIFFTTAFIFVFYHFIESKQYSFQIFLVFSILVIGAFYTKSIASFIPLAAIGFYVILTPKNYFIFKQYHFYLGAACILFICFSYYFIREHYDLGYFRKAIFSSEISMYNRKDIKSNFWYYIGYFFSQKLNLYTLFLLFVPLTLSIKKLQTKYFRTKQLVIYLLIVAISILLIHSYSLTKRGWYNAPAIPIFVFAIACIMYELFIIIQASQNMYKVYIITLSFVSILFVLVISYMNVYRNVYDNKSYTSPDNKDYASYFIKQISEFRTDIKSIHYVTNDLKYIYCDNVYFYKYSLASKGVSIYIQVKEDIVKGDTVLVKKNDKLLLPLWKNKKAIFQDSAMVLFVY
jgi:4-amino-4-deoxy-L-arabinose transferase-like glycosyltransferase